MNKLYWSPGVFVINVGPRINPVVVVGHKGFPIQPVGQGLVALNAR